MPGLAALLATASPSPTGNPLDTTATGRTLVFLAMGATAFLFVMAIASTFRRRGSGL
jgi:hypothetical protein